MMTINKKCRICGSEDVRLFLDLLDQPPANKFLKFEELNGVENIYPLKVYWCANCNLAQLVHVVDKEELFKNYIYFSSGMPKLSNHFEQYAKNVMEKYLKPNDLVVEIASNDGILLKFFKEHGYRVCGVDPAENIVAVARERGVHTECDFFSESLANELVKEHGPAKAILANNVVAHINDHHDLAKGVAALLADDGVFVLEAPYLIDMFERLTYDTIYHEHLSFLAVRPLQVLFNSYGLEIFDVEIHPVQGQSIRVFVGKQGRHPIHDHVRELVQKELDFGLNTFEAYQKLADRISSCKQKLLKTLDDIKKDGKKIAAYGASAKGNTVLNYCRIGTEYLDYALEDLPSKQGLFTPGQHLPVVNRAHAELNPPDYYLLLAWNYLDAILAKEKLFKDRGGKFIIPVGDEIRII